MNFAKIKMRRINETVYNNKYADFHANYKEFYA